MSGLPRRKRIKGLQAAWPLQKARERLELWGFFLSTLSILFWKLLVRSSPKHILPCMTTQGHESMAFLMPLLRFVRVDYSQR